MSIVVGTLTIDLKANTASFSQSMDKMSQLSAKSAKRYQTLAGEDRYRGPGFGLRVWLPRL